jgi:23S rRNA-/tRNA-specific pseudouridylate synthase
MLPLQHYHGLSLNQNKYKRHETLYLNKIGLSNSSRSLSNKIGALSDEERRRFHSKVEAEARASQPLYTARDLHILYRDSDIVVTNKPSSILCVPGPRRNPSLANLVHSELHTPIDIDKTVVHRIDMDPSGIVVFAASEQALINIT